MTFSFLSLVPIVMALNQMDFAAKDKINDDTLKVLGIKIIPGLQWLASITGLLSS